MAASTDSSPADPEARAAPRLRSFGLTDPGRVRPANEDQFLIAELSKSMRVLQTSLDEGSTARPRPERGHLFLVADGMGGHNAGERASALAIAAIEQFALDTFKWFLRLHGPDTSEVTSEFTAAVEEADARIRREAAGHRELQGMGTTLTLAYSYGWELFVMHVGDSRAYVFRDGELRQLTRDHTLVAEMVRRGDLDEHAARRHRLRHVITNVLGGTEAGVHAEAHTGSLQPGDALLLCSDGLTEMLSHDEIAAVLRADDDPETACRHLVALANGHGGTDNITAIVARFSAG